MRQIEMKGKILSLLVGCLLLSLILIACSSPAPEEQKPTLTEEQLGQMEKETAEKGIWNVDTLEAASQIADFTVATPGYLPEGFYRGSNIMVTQLGGGLPEEIRPKFPSMTVQQFYYYQGDDSVMFMLQQTQHKTGLGGGEPAEVCGRQGERTYLEADPRRKYPSPILILAWENNGNYYQIIGTLAGPIDEATLEKIACSVGTD
jgi:hypothetical protein